MARKKYIYVLWILGIILLGTGIYEVIQGGKDNQYVEANETNTDLSKVTIYGMQLGESIDSIDQQQYGTREDLLQKENEIHFKDFSVQYNTDHKVQYIQTTTYEGNQYFKIGNQSITTVEEAVTWLGDGYQDIPYDNDQALNALEYKDKDNGIQLQIVHSTNKSIANNIVWVILQKSQQS